MKISDVIEVLESQGEWVDRGRTKDQVLFGDTSAELGAVGVCWTATLDILERAAADGVNLVVSHENPFYLESTSTPLLVREARQRKRELCERHGIAVYRCHDLWDLYPELGVLDAWATALGMGEVAERAGFIRLLRNVGLTAREVAQRVARTASDCGEGGATLVGDPMARVSTLAVGTGAITDAVRMRELGADACVVTDDGVRNWVEVQWTSDEGIPLIVVNHRTSEMAGMRGLRDYLASQLPDVRVALYESARRIEHVVA